MPVILPDPTPLDKSIGTPPLDCTRSWSVTCLVQHTGVAGAPNHLPVQESALLRSWPSGVQPVRRSQGNGLACDPELVAGTTRCHSSGMSGLPPLNLVGERTGEKDSASQNLRPLLVPTRPQVLEQPELRGAPRVSRHQRDGIDPGHR